MTDKRYDIAFAGRLVDGADPATVKRELARVLKVAPEKLEPVFAGRRATLARGVDAGKAKAYKAAFERIGAIPEIRLAAEVTATAPAATARKSEETPAATAPPDTGADADPASPPRPADLTVAEVGATLVEPIEVAPPEYDLSGLSMAEVGVDLAEPQKIAPPEYDLTSLALDPPGTDLSDAPRPAPAEFDLSGLSLDEGGNETSE